MCSRKLKWKIFFDWPICFHCSTSASPRSTNHGSRCRSCSFAVFMHSCQKTISLLNNCPSCITQVVLTVHNQCFRFPWKILQYHQSTLKLYFWVFSCFRHSCKCRRKETRSKFLSWWPWGGFFEWFAWCFWWCEGSSAKRKLSQSQAIN